MEVGLHALVAFSGASAMEYHGSVDAVILDTVLPDVDGFELCQRMRSLSPVPIIIHSCRSTERDRVMGLKLGADDYVTKPCGTWELAARIESVVRRSQVPSETERRRKIVKFGPLSVDPNQYRVEADGKEVPLTNKEFDMLMVLLSRPGDVIRRTEIMRRVWGHDGTGDTRTLGVHMVSLRRKLAIPSLIATVRGVGYRIVV